MINETMMHSAI